MPVKHLIQTKVEAFHFVSAHKQPFGKDDRFAVTLFQRKGAVAQDVVFQNVTDGIAASVIRAIFVVGAVRLVSYAEKFFPAGGGIAD